ncbi:MAG: aspartate dehydrogenase [Blautia sp.]|nr:aspartate dehydrogenase [Blautia sp.]
MKHLFFSRKKPEPAALSFDPAEKYPVLRCSICNGEKVAGLKNRQTGEFEEVMLVRTEEDLRTFERMTGTADIPKEY